MLCTTKIYFTLIKLRPSRLTIKEENKRLFDCEELMNYRIEILIILLMAYCTISFAQSNSGWVAIDSLLEARVGHTIVVLPNDNILVSGGEGGYVNSRKASSEIYDLTTGKWRYTAPMNIKRFLHNLVLLKTGKILAIGGYEERSCELFDPVTETWTMTDSIPTMRFDGQTVTELKDGRILVGGGFRDSANVSTGKHIKLTACEIYDPITEKWIRAASINIARYNHTATLLEDGKVMVAGGFGNSLELRSSEIYNPIDNTWIVCDSLNEPRSQASSILLPNGNVFISGGGSLGVNIIPWKKSGEVFDVIGKKWSYVKSMFDARLDHQIYYMAKTNHLLIIGGAIGQKSKEDTWETYDPIDYKPLQYGIFPMKKIFSRRNIVKLKDDRIIIAGGIEYDFSIWDGMPYAWTSKSSQLFDILTSVEEPKLKPDSYVLFQNYPNPFNPTTEIKYSLPKSAYTKLDVYDALGRFVKSLVNSYQNTGNYHIQFIAKELPCGIYFYRLLSGTYSETKKMLFIK